MSFTYSNGIDFAAVRQVTGPGQSTAIAQVDYDYRHRPVTYTDAAGLTTLMAYNAKGQLTAVTNPLGEKTTYQYDGSSNLMTLINANNQSAATYTYDSFARVRTYTDSEGWTVTYDYDAADRVTKVTYADGTAETSTYDRLDLVHRRRGTTQFTYVPVGSLGALQVQRPFADSAITSAYDESSAASARTVQGRGRRPFSTTPSAG